MDFYCNISGEAEAILARSQATAEGLKVLSEAMKAEGGAQVRLPSTWLLVSYHDVLLTMKNQL